MDSSEDLFIAECTPRYPWKEKLALPLEDTHHVFGIVVGPEDALDPNKQPWR